MKYLFLFLSLSTLTVAGCGATKSVPLQIDPHVIQASARSQEDIYNNSLLWVADTYNSAEAVITFQNEYVGAIYGEANGEVHPKLEVLDRSFSYKFVIEVREGKARISFYNVKPTGSAPISLSNSFHRDSLSDYFKTLSLKYDAYMENTPHVF